MDDEKLAELIRTLMREEVERVVQKSERRTMNQLAEYATQINHSIGDLLRELSGMDVHLERANRRIGRRRAHESCTVLISI